MPRIGPLLPLSREHHQTLVMARDARCEERLVKMAEDALDPDLVTRFLSEHAELRALADGSCGLSPADRLRRFGELASAHVRYEERVFFPHLQSHPSVVFADEEGNA